MKTMNIIYRVTIEKKKTSWGNPNFKWEVEVHDNPGNQNQNWDLRACDWTYTEKAAKRRALKHILSVQKDLEAGAKFGVVFSSEGTVSDLEKSLNDR